MPRACSSEFAAFDAPLGLHLARIDPALVQLRQAAFCGRAALPFRFGGSSMRMCFVDDDRAAHFEPAVALLLRVGQLQGWLLLATYDVAGEEWADVFERLDPLLARALLIEEATQLFTQAGAACGETVQLVDLQVGQTFVTEVPTAALRIENPATGIGSAAALRSDNPDFFLRLAAALERQPLRERAMPAAACLPLQLQLGRIWLKPEEARAARGGDVLLLPPCGMLQSLRATCHRRGGGRLPLAAALEAGTGRIEASEGETMSNEANEMMPALQEVGVPVTVVIGELELPLSALGSLQNGYVFELPTAVEVATVQLYTGSRRVGVGRLVAIGERLGVRLVEWGGSGDAVEPA